MPLLAVTSLGRRDPLPPQGFALLATPVFARLLVAFLDFQPFEKPVVLDFFLQNPHGFFKVVVIYFDFDSLQADSPPSSRRQLYFVSAGYFKQLYIAHSEAFGKHYLRALGMV